MYGMVWILNKKQTITVKFILAQLILFLLYLYACMNINKYVNIFIYYKYIYINISKQTSKYMNKYKHKTPKS